MKKINILAASSLTALLLSSISIPAFATNTVVAPDITLDTNSTCVDTSYQIKTFLNEEKIVYPQKSATEHLTSPYGPRIGVNPQLGNKPEFHSGTDYSQGVGTPIYAIAAGVVTKAGKEPYGDGQMIVIEHNLKGEKWTTMYLHLVDANEDVKVGQRVITGQKIANEGKSGNVTGPHLHFEIWKGEYLKGEHQDPAKWLQEHKALDITDNTLPNFTCNKGTIFDGKISAWGDFRNGEIPAEKMTVIPFNSKFSLETESANKLIELNTEFKTVFKRNIPVDSAYKSLEQQIKEAKEISGSPLPGMANAGWGKSLKLYYSNPEGGVKPFTSISDYNPFYDVEYKWLLENAPRYGWVNPIVNQEGNDDPEAERFIFVGVEEATKQPTKEDLHKYARIAMIPYNWTDKESQCLINTWEKVSGWNPALVNGDSVGIAQVFMTTKFGPEWQTNVDAQNFMKSPRSQIEEGLRDIKATGKNPCGE